MTDNITITKAPYSSYYLLIIINDTTYISNWVLDNTDLPVPMPIGTQTGKDSVLDAKPEVTPTK